MSSANSVARDHPPPTYIPPPYIPSKGHGDVQLACLRKNAASSISKRMPLALFPTRITQVGRFKVFEIDVRKKILPMVGNPATVAVVCKEWRRLTDDSYQFLLDAYQNRHVSRFTIDISGNLTQEDLKYRMQILFKALKEEAAALVPRPDLFAALTALPLFPEGKINRNSPLGQIRDAVIAEIKNLDQQIAATETKPFWGFNGKCQTLPTERSFVAYYTLTSRRKNLILTMQRFDREFDGAPSTLPKTQNLLPSPSLIPKVTATASSSSSAAITAKKANSCVIL